MEWNMEGTKEEKGKKGECTGVNTCAKRNIYGSRKGQLRRSNFDREQN